MKINLDDLTLNQASGEQSTHLKNRRLLWRKCRLVSSSANSFSIHTVLHLLYVFTESFS